MPIPGLWFSIMANMVISFILVHYDMFFFGLITVKVQRSDVYQTNVFSIAKLSCECNTVSIM